MGTETGGLAPGEATEVTFNVTARELSIVDFSGKGDRVLAPGNYQLSWETGDSGTSVTGVSLTI
eukprot:SAG11_NODE_24925_length_366_cov_0.580524_1_plen_63_part_01